MKSKVLVIALALAAVSVMSCVQAPSQPPVSALEYSQNFVRHNAAVISLVGAITEMKPVARDMETQTRWSPFGSVLTGNVSYTFYVGGTRGTKYVIVNVMNDGSGWNVRDWRFDGPGAPGGTVRAEAMPGASASYEPQPQAVVPDEPIAAPPSAAAVGNESLTERGFQPYRPKPGESAPKPVRY